MKMLYLPGQPDETGPRGLWLRTGGEATFVAAEQLPAIGVCPSPPAPSDPPVLAEPRVLASLRVAADPTVERALELACWRARLAATAPGPELNRLLEEVPQFRVSGEDVEHQLGRAQVDVEFIVACQRQVAHLESLSCQRMARLSRDYPGLREFYEFELALALGVSEGAAQLRVAEANRLVDDLPGSLAALRAGWCR